MKVGVVGSRDYSDKDFVYQVLDTANWMWGGIECIVSGGAKGPDQFGAEWCKEVLRKDPIIFIPDWKLHGKKAGFLRNLDIVKQSDRIIAFWDGESKGTKHTIDECKKMGKPCHIFMV